MSGFPHHFFVEHYPDHFHHTHKKLKRLQYIFVDGKRALTLLRALTSSGSRMGRVQLVQAPVRDRLRRSD